MLYVGRDLPSLTVWGQQKVSDVFPEAELYSNNLQYLCL